MIACQLPLLGRVVRDVRKVYYSGPSLIMDHSRVSLPDSEIGTRDNLVLVCKSSFKALSSLTSGSCTLADSRITPEQAVEAGKDMVYLLPESEAREKGALFKNAHFGQSKVQ